MMERINTSAITHAPVRQKKALSFVSVGATCLLLLFLGLLLWYVWPNSYGSQASPNLGANEVPAVQAPPTVPIIERSTADQVPLQSQQLEGTAADTVSSFFPTLNELGTHPMFAPLRPEGEVDTVTVKQLEQQ